MRRRQVLNGLAAMAAAPALGFAWVERLAAPKAELIDTHWTRHDAANPARVDHAVWAAFLERYLVVRDVGANRVRYAAVTAGDHALLGEYVDGLAATAVTRLAPIEQLAFWLNLYNALTVRAVLDHYPVASIKDATYGGRAGSGPWRQPLATVEGRPLSLDDIEHGIVRPVFGDARIHYGVNCAALGCPSLLPEPFTAATLDRRLDGAARTFVGDPRGVAFTTGGGVTASSIYNWFQADFGGSEATVLDHLRGFAAGEVAARLAAARGIDRYAYDWGLNDV